MPQNRRETEIPHKLEGARCGNDSFTKIYGNRKTKEKREIFTTKDGCAYNALYREVANKSKSLPLQVGQHEAQGGFLRVSGAKHVENRGFEGMRMIWRWRWWSWMMKGRRVGKE